MKDVGVLKAKACFVVENEDESVEVIEKRREKKWTSPWYLCDLLKRGAMTKSNGRDLNLKDPLLDMFALPSSLSSCASCVHKCVGQSEIVLARKMVR